ncbi:MAG: prepilin-type N-terminal cleavage/methylation domain-containing protein [Heliobacteriaceae bacterium]|nr:prepilin-type N-terminal cleavage/methylation domain-containing protein [Heliobacteriaceae bacterium]
MAGREKGLTLIEVMIALTVLSIVTYGVFELLNLNNRVFSREERQATVRQEVRQAIDRFLMDIQAAGDVVVPDGKRMELIIRDQAGDRRVVYALNSTTGDPAVYHLYVDGDRLPVRVLSGTDKEDFKLAQNMVWIDLQYADDSTLPKEAAAWLRLKTAVLPRATKGSGSSERVLLGIFPQWNQVTVAKSAWTTNPVTAWFSDGREDVTAAATYLDTPDLIEVVAGSILGNLAGRADVVVSYTWGAITKTAQFAVVVTEGMGPPLISPFDDVDWVFTGGTGGGVDPGYWQVSPDGVEVDHKREAGHEDYGYFENYRLGTVFDYKMKVTLKNNRNQAGTAGILVHFDGTGAGYILRLDHQADADKVVPYFGVKGAETASPVEFQPYDGTYELKVLAREGGNYTFFVNNVPVGTLTDNTYENGYAGIYATCKAGFADLVYVEP